MNSNHKRWLHVLVTGLTVLSLVLNLALPLAAFVSTARAQEATADPAPETPPDDTTPPEVTAEATESPTATPPPEITPAPEAPTPVPTQPPTAFADDFQDGNVDGWLLTPGWTLVSDGGNLFLTAAEPAQAATISGLIVSNFALSARLRVERGQTASVAFRSGADNYSVSLDAGGSAALYRGAVVLAQGAVLPGLPEGVPAPWHTLNIQAYDGLIVVSINGTPQIVYTDPTPLLPGLVSFGTAAGGLSLDEVAVSPLTAPIQPPVIPPPVVPTPEVTPDVTIVPEVTPELTPEATVVPEATPELTPEATVQPEITPESTPEVTPEPEVLILSADFEGDLTGWNLGDGAAVVADGDSNHALLLAAGGSLLPASLPHLSAVRVEARLSLLEAADGAASGLSLPFHTGDGTGYVLSIEAAQTTLSRNDGAGLVPLASVPASHDINIWHTLTLTAKDGRVTVTVNGIPELEYADPAPLPGGTLAFVANGAVMLDDIAVYAPAALLEAVTPAPLALADDEKAKLAAVLIGVLERYTGGDEAGAFQQAQDAFLTLDDQMRLSVEVWAAEGQSGAAVAPIVEAVGGQVNYVGDYHVEASVPLAGFVALLNTDAVIHIRPTLQATSTGSANAPAAAPSGPTVTEGFDILGANDWHAAGVLGAGVKIAVIDTGFAGISTLPAAEVPATCLPSRTVNVAPGLSGVGTTNHGTRVAEVLCDIAPSAPMTLHRAANASQLANRIGAARTAGSNIILITMDVGANAAPGDGSEGLAVSGSMYDQISAARSEGRLVIVSAGNNNGRYASFTHTGGSTVVNITASAGDFVNVSWNDWNTTGDKVDLTMTMTGATGAYTGRALPATAPAHQFTVAAPCVSCAITLTISGITPVTTTSAYVQVQVTGSGTIGAVSGPSNVNRTSTIGRPADSPDALAVGAVCAAPGSFPLLDDSSQGPVFGSGGDQPPAGPFASRGSFKPDIVSPSGVATSTSDPNFVFCSTDDPDNTAFIGTSAAAAHAAGIAALIRSNPNANISATTPDAITHYLQSHAVDLYDASVPTNEANGFDMRSGAGLAVLGNPQPDYALKPNPPTSQPLPTSACPGGTIRYVDPNNLGGSFTAGYGTFANPYVHAGHAIAANTTAGADCVVLMPGEYVTPVNILSGLVNNGVRVFSYDTALNLGKPIELNTTPDSVFWVNLSGYDGQGNGSGGLFVTINALTIEGFIFRGSTRLGDLLTDPAALYLAGVNGGTVRNSIFTRFVSATPLEVRPFGGVGSQSVVIEGNTFRNNNDNQATGAAGVGIHGDFGAASGGPATPIVVQFNTFTENISTSQPGQFEAAVYVRNGYANIYNNRFYNNATQSLISVSNSNNAYTVNVFGNAFSRNTNTGPVVHLNPGRTFRFINNTVGGSRSFSIDSSFIILRGIPGASPTNGSGNWDVFNNLFYDNTASSPLADADTGSALCHRVGVSSGPEQGAQNNWVFRSGDPTVIGGPGGICFNPMASGNPLGNRLLLDSTPADFRVVGPDIVPEDPYQLVAAASPSPDDGVDDGGNALVSAALLAGKDVLKRNRVENATIDIGAYEYRAISAANLSPTMIEDSTNTAGQPVPLVFALEAEGGFPPYTFTVNEFPTLYDTNPSNACAGQPLKLTVNPLTKVTQATYCPPKNLYTQGAPAASQVAFTYHARDRAGNQTQTPGTVTVVITPANDQPLAEAIDEFVTVEAEAPPAAFTPIQFRLRPYVRFDDNFYYSEDGEQEDLLNGSKWNNTPGADYPYTYAYVAGSLTNLEGALGVTEGEITAAITAANSSQNSLVTLEGAVGEKGKFSFRYSVNESTAQNTVTVEVVSVLPHGGLHDDTSFTFSYDTNWTPLYNEGSINNTLHQSSVNGATASFRFVGTGFALYMQGATTGAYWELRVDGQPFNWNGSKIATRAGITCRTTAATGTAGTVDNSKFISNKQATAYTVSCTRLRQGEAHTVEIINRALTRSPLNIDAIGILVDNALILPGFHEVREAQIVPLFFGWNEITGVGPSNGIALATTDPAAADVTFTFKGTGFAIGTTLEQIRAAVPPPVKGAQYTICVAPAATGTPQVCQSFDNSVGATTVPVWNVFRPFAGFNPDVEHEVTIDITAIPPTGRMVIDSIVVFDRRPAAVLPLGTTEDTNRADIVFGGGLEDSWMLDTNNSRASASSLTSIISTVTKAGPFVSFQIPDEATSFAWWRSAGTTDSTSMLVCVDRAQLESSDSQTTFCVVKPLRTTTAPLVTHNPLVVAETDFGLDGWGDPNSGGAHTVEIFSLTNQPFNFDRVQVLSSTAPLQPSMYEQTVPNLCYFDDDQAGLPCDDGTAPESSVTMVNNVRASGGSVAFIKERNEGVFFRFTGTGFSTLFTLDTRGGSVRLCWLKDELQTAAVNDVLTAGTCQQYDNRSVTPIYQAARTIAGLENATYAAVVQHIGAADWVSATSGNSMQVDAIHIYGDRWHDLNELTPLPNGQRYETSFANQAANNQMNYLGGPWRSFSGTAALSYSGQNYDQVRAYGAGIVFRTNGADMLRLYRDIRLGYAPLRVCHAPHAGGVVNYALYECADIRNDGGTAFQSAFNVYLGSGGPHVVSVTTLNAGIFNLDAIEPVNSTPPLQPGIYPETDARLIFSYGAADPDTIDINAKWRNLALASYLDKAVLQSLANGASLTFSFTGTGFSLFTLLDNTSSSLTIEVSTIAGAINATSFNSRIYYGHAHSVTGLPFATYQVTVSETDAARSKFTVDGIEIYGAYSATLAPGIYDDNALNADGTPPILYGPRNAAWAVNLGTRAPANLNKSNHTTNRQGATLAFAVSGANAITLHHIGSTSTSVAVCVTPAAGGTRACEARTLVGNNNSTFDSPALFPAVGSYFVSVTNLTPGVTLIVDAIGVLNTTGSVMQPGIYQENSSLLTFAPVPAGWPSAFLTEISATDRRVKGTAVGSSGQTLTFTFSGTGFSIVLVESTTTSKNYSLTVNGTLVTTLPTPNANTAASAARAPSALTYAGFTPGVYTVVLTNLDPAKPLLVDRVDVLGNVNDIAAAVTGGVENTDARIVYFPYFSFNETAAAAASGGSQHIGTIRGAAAYFELNTGAFEYVRETRSAYGQVTACSGTFDANGSTDCTPTSVPNNQPLFGYQQAASVPAVSGGWALLRNADGRQMPLDFVRPTNAALALTAGYYENTFVSDSLTFEGAFTLTPVTAASGGSVHRTETTGDAVLFEFNGTGFSTYFVFDTKADAVQICWRSGLNHDLAATQAGTCATYDNQSAAVRYRAARTILGLPDGDYTASVQMLADNNAPAPHTPAATPIAMQVDAIQIHDDALPGSLLDAPGTRYETSFANRAADQLYLYYGQGWRSVSGTAARSYSGQNYDTIANVIGAGLLFRTSNADSIIVYRVLGAASAPMEICSQRVDNGSRGCVAVANNAGAGVQPTVAVPLVDPGYTGERIVSIITLNAGTLTLDAIEIGSSAAPLQPGLYEDVHPGLKFLNGAFVAPEVAWTGILSASYSGGQARWTNDDEATLEFSFEDATGFEVGAVVNPFGGEMEICYRTNNNTWADTANNRCYTYQNENARTSYTTSRTVTGLNAAATYFVRVAHDDEKYPDLPPPRSLSYTPARLVIDYVRVFGETLPPPITESGQFNEDAASGGVKYLQLLPSNRWFTFTGAAARGFSSTSFAGVVDNLRRSSSLYAGPAATLRLNKPGSAATVVLYTGPASTLNPPQVLVCANSVTEADCVTITNLNTTNQIVLNSANLPALANAANITLSFRALLPGQFRIDGFQVVYGSTLLPGVYDDFLAGSSGLLNTGASTWATVKSTRAYGGTLIRTQTQNAAITFDFDGTGFSVLTQADRLGADMRLCYVLKASFDGTFDGTGETCQTVTTNTLTTGAAGWAARNGSRPNPLTAYQYGFAVHGLPPGIYTAEARHVDTTAIPTIGTRTDWLQIDAVAVFGAAGAPLPGGTIHDDTHPNIVYSPAGFWTLLSTPFGPSRGPWNRTVHNTTAVGAIAQFQIQGNALVLYQTGGSLSSRKIQLCVTTIDGQECTDFSQSTRTTYFTPVAFYGFGKGATHQIVVENWDYGRTLSIDALQVLP